jgi:hypothetical protein
MVRIRKICAFFFLLISGYFVVPAELVHELTFHEDTEDVACDPGSGLNLSAEHHHCETLQLFVPPCLVADGRLQFLNQGSIRVHYDLEMLSPVLDATGSFLIRGPPSHSFFC